MSYEIQNRILMIMKLENRIQYIHALTETYAEHMISSAVYKCKCKEKLLQQIYETNELLLEYMNMINKIYFDDQNDKEVCIDLYTAQYEELMKCKDAFFEYAIKEDTGKAFVLQKHDHDILLKKVMKIIEK